MRSFVSFMNHLRFPLSPFAKDVSSFSKRKKVQSIQQDNHCLGLKELENDNYVFHKTEHASKTYHNRVGVVLSGGQASGGHNVIWGLFEGLKQINPDCQLIGFLSGPQGIIDNQFIEIEEGLLSEYKNTGGFDIIGSGRTKIETNEQLEKSLSTIKAHSLDGLVIIGGDDSNTNAAVLANYFLKNKVSCQVIGVPKTVDGDLKNEFVEVSFGFDTASKLYSELTSNILRDCLSAKKYYHFIKIMGRSASHLALEVYLNSKPNMLLVIEEIKEHQKTLLDVCHEIKDMVLKRSLDNKNFGVVLIPEGVIEVFSDVAELIHMLNKLSKDNGSVDLSKLPQNLKDLIGYFPEEVKKQLLLDLDPHGNIQVSLIETEKLIAHVVHCLIKKQSPACKFQAVCHFFGYEGRSCFPSYFDAIYSYHLGIGASICLKDNLTGYMVGIKNLNQHPDNWTLYALSIVSLMHMEIRKGQQKPVIKKALVDMTQSRYQSYLSMKETRKWVDDYQFIGPMQYSGSFDELYMPPHLLND